MEAEQTFIEYLVQIFLLDAFTHGPIFISQ